MKLIYRPEIDGLRAIAIGAVILYHAQITILGHQPFKGGFIGVDIFFVISGYLITSIILKELVTTGTFSFKHFYKRRVRRILPALLFVMLASLPFAWMYLLPNNFVDFSKSIIYSILFSSNFYFHYSGQLYGAESGLLKPFLHTWSLSIEEQYYILFPIVLLITFKYFKKYLIHILILGFILSLGLAEWTSRSYPSKSFYFLHTRMWELLAGSILAYFEITFGHRSKNKTLNLILPTIGLFLIGHSILFFNDKMLHPSLHTLSPIVGVCLIIWFSKQNELITKILTTKLFVGIGLISYSLYLWHYPIFALARIKNATLSELDKFECITLSILLSLVTYFFIEKPIKIKKINSKIISIFLLSSLLFLIIFNSNVLIKEGLKQRLPEIFQKKLKEKDVNFFQKDNTRKVVLIGDSHAESLEFTLNEEIKKKDFSLFRFPTRMYLTNFNYIYKKNNQADENFIKENNIIDNFLNENSNLIIIFHQRWTIRFLETLFNNEEGQKEENDLNYHSHLVPFNLKFTTLEDRQMYFEEGLRLQIKKIINQGHKLILVYPVPEMGFNVPKKIFRENLLISIPSMSSSYEVFKKRNRSIFAILDSIKSSNIYRVYPHKIFCNTQIQNRCIANDKNDIFYYDDDHLSLQGSKFVVDEIMKIIEKIEIESN